MKTRCLFLDGPRAGTTLETNTPQETYYFVQMKETRNMLASDFPSDDMVTVKKIEYKATFRSISWADTPMYLYTLSGKPDSMLKNSDWVVPRTGKNLPIRFMQGVDVHRKNEILARLEQAKSILKNPASSDVRGAMLYFLGDLFDLVNMRTGGGK